MVILHRAPYVIPVSSPIIEDGGVLCQKGQIIRIGKFNDLQSNADKIIDHENSILTPALINGHAHLELSHLAALGKTTSIASNNITDWIRNLLAKRETSEAKSEDIMREAHKSLIELRAGGCITVADIGNHPESRFIAKNTATHVLFFLEMLGLSNDADNGNMETLHGLVDDIHCTAHAPYSTSPKLIRHLKKRTNSQKTSFPVHVAESKDEITFLMTGKGPIRDFLDERGAWDDAFIPPQKSSVSYLNDLGVLDDKTVCVHAVHVSNEEVEILAERQAKICLCPGSNRYMGVGKAPVKKILDHGLLPALGTDSLASNPTLNIWREMRMLLEDNPELDPETIFSMATQGGAEAFGMDDQFGTLGPGKSSKFITVQYQEDAHKNIYEFLVNKGEAAEIEWIA